MFPTVLIESHAEMSLCMQIHTLLTSISAGRGGGVLVHELSDRFFFNVLTAILSATAEQSFNVHVLYLHTQGYVSLLIIAVAYLQ